MESITIELPELGAMGYLLGYIFATLASGTFMWRNIERTGLHYARESKARHCPEGESHKMMGDSCFAKSIVSGLIMLTFLIMVLLMSYNLFEKAMK
ncbi:MAG: hypothetical protein ACXAC5_01950 [Promethearchaeota archaeon]|jgi:uncharacterized iron-regulated membrane protein